MLAKVLRPQSETGLSKVCSAPSPVRYVVVFLGRLLPSARDSGPALMVTLWIRARSPWQRFQPAVVVSYTGNPVR